VPVKTVPPGLDSLRGRGKKRRIDLYTFVRLGAHPGVSRLSRPNPGPITTNWFEWRAHVTLLVEKVGSYLILAIGHERNETAWHSASSPSLVGLPPFLC
jgi:hypothetical protein